MNVQSSKQNRDSDQERDLMAMAREHAKSATLLFGLVHVETNPLVQYNHRATAA